MTTKKGGELNCDTMEKRKKNREREEIKNIGTTETKEVNVRTNNRHKRSKC